MSEQECRPRDPLKIRLALHASMTCPGCGGEAWPEPGKIEHEGAKVDLAVYRCPHSICGWFRAVRLLDLARDGASVAIEIEV